MVWPGVVKQCNVKAVWLVQWSNGWDSEVGEESVAVRASSAQHRQKQESYRNALTNTTNTVHDDEAQSREERTPLAYVEFTERGRIDLIHTFGTGKMRCRPDEAESTDGSDAKGTM